MKIIKSKFRESSLSRLVQHIQEHDTGTITAFRDGFTKKENKQRNKSLLAKLSSSGYGITSVQGSYIENFGTPEAVEVGENVFFVTDIKDKGQLEKDLQKFGEEFDQDSILSIPKGGKQSALIGTNKTGYPGYGKRMNFPVLKFGKDNNEFLTKVNGRPFFFTEQVLKETYCGTNAGRYAAGVDAKKHWRDLEV